LNLCPLKQSRENMSPLVQPREQAEASPTCKQKVFRETRSVNTAPPKDVQITKWKEKLHFLSK